MESEIQPLGAMKTGTGIIVWFIDILSSHYCGKVIKVTDLFGKLGCGGKNEIFEDFRLLNIKFGINKTPKLN